MFFKLEIKRIFSKRVNRFVIGVALILAVIFSGFAVSSNRYVDQDGNASTGFDATRKLTASKSLWKGTLTEDKILKAYEENKAAYQRYSMEELDAKYGSLLQPMADVKDFMISVLTPDSEYDETVLEQASREEMESFYNLYRQNQKAQAREYGKTEEQVKYIEKQYEKVKLPVHYEPYGSWDVMILYGETYGIILAIIIGFLCAGIFADDFQTKAYPIFFAAKYGRSKAIKIKILAGITVATAVYWVGIGLLSVISFGILGVSGWNTPYQMQQAYSIYAITYGQYYLIVALCGYIASLLAAALSMLVAAKMHTVSVAICIPFFLYCVCPFIGRAMHGLEIFWDLMPMVLINIQEYAKRPFVFRIGSYVSSQIPFIMVLYTAVSLLLLPLIYRTFRRYGHLFQDRSCV